MADPVIIAQNGAVPLRALAFGAQGDEPTPVDATHPLPMLPVGNPDSPMIMRPSGIVASANFTPGAAAHGAGDLFDVAKEFAFTRADGTPVTPGALIRILTTIVKIDINALQASEGAYVLQCYSATQPSAQADNDAWTLASGDLPSYRGSIALGTPVDLGAALYVKQPLVDLDIKLASDSSSLWGVLTSTPAFTPTAVARQVLLYAIEL